MKTVYKHKFVNEIISIVSIVTEISVDTMLKHHVPGVRKRELCLARQISMKLSKKYTNYSLAVIGRFHGDRDHATVLHACRTIDDLLDVKDKEVTYLFNKAEKQLNTIKIFDDTDIDVDLKTRIKLVKKFIKCKIPLHIRQKMLKEYNRVCPYCHQKLKL